MGRRSRSARSRCQASTSRSTSSRTARAYRREILDIERRLAARIVRRISWPAVLSMWFLTGRQWFWGACCTRWWPWRLTGGSRTPSRRGSRVRNAGHSRAGDLVRHYTTVLDVAELIWTKIKRPDVPFRYVSDPGFEHDVQKGIPSVENAKRVLGFEATTNLSEMRDEVIPWIDQAVKDRTI